MTTVNRRGMYFAPTHGRQEDWDFLREWQPSVVRLMLPGSHSDPNSVSLDMVQRVHDAAPDALIILRVWDVDDRNGDAKHAMAADPEGFADEYHAWWKALFDRLPADLREQCMAGSVNEPFPEQFGPLKPFTRRLCRNGTRDKVRYGVLVFSAGTPGKPGEGPHDWPYFADLEPDIVEGNHAVMLHEYMQPEGMYGEWIDDEGNHRSDYENLISRHHHCPYTEAPIIIGEWGIEGILFNRHPDPMHGGHAGWQYFPGLWPASRYADEYVACVQDASPNVIAECPFISDWKDKKWRTADLLPAYDEFLAHKQDCVVQVASDKSPDSIHNDDSVSQDDHKTHLPNVQSGNPQPTAAPEQTQPAAVTVPELVHPVAEPSARRVTQRFGDNPQDYEQFGLQGHAGLDFATPVGTPIVPVDAGEVVEAANDADGYGKYVKLSHAWGESLYAHLSEIHVDVGEPVAKGAPPVGLSGNTGNSTGDHLHFAMRVHPYDRTDGWDGFTDPAPYLSGSNPHTSRAEIRKLIKRAASEFGVEWPLYASLIWAESSYRPDAESPRGAQGLAQIVPATYAEWAPRVGANDDPFDARDNLRVGAAYLRWLLDQLGNEWSAVAAYNFGIKNVLDGVEPPEDTVIYIRSVLHGADLLREWAAT